MQLELIHHLLLRKTDLGTLKSNVDKLDIDNLVPAPVDLSKLSDVPKNYVVKKRCIRSKILKIKCFILQS